MSEARYQSFAEFWPYYVREHSVPGCRALHFIGSTLVIGIVLAAIFYNPWLWLAVPLVGYGFAWFGHFVIEKNRPATFKYPLWSLIADWKMWAMMLTGRMGAEVQKAHAAVSSARAIQLTSTSTLPETTVIPRTLRALSALACSYLPIASLAAAAEPNAQPAPSKQLRVKHTADFEITGDGRAAAWQAIPWEPLVRRGKEGHAYEARFKTLYSPQGLYVLMNGTDRKLTATLNEDFLDLWNEDVFEFFLWPDERQSIYFEYEISPLGHELPILVPNVDGKFLGWRPWHYEGDRRIRKATTVTGGEKRSGATIDGWTAEVFVPYKLLEPLAGVPPKPGSKWRANFYRVDYDDGRETSWDWARVGPSFHEFKKFGTLIFE